MIFSTVIYHDLQKNLNIMTYYGLQLWLPVRVVMLGKKKNIYLKRTLEIDAADV